MDVQADDAQPTCAQIQRACHLYSVGINSTDFRAAFANELPPEAMVLAWCAAVAAFNVDERMGFT